MSPSPPPDTLPSPPPPWVYLLAITLADARLSPGFREEPPSSWSPLRAHALWHGLPQWQRDCWLEYAERVVQHVGIVNRELPR